MITSAQCRAARGLLDWSQQELADKANIGIVTVRQLEAGKHEPRKATLDVVRRAFEAAGIEFIDENGGGPGVRLKKAAQEAHANADLTRRCYLWGISGAARNGQLRNSLELPTFTRLDDASRARGLDFTGLSLSPTDRGRFAVIRQRKWRRSSDGRMMHDVDLEDYQ